MSNKANSGQSKLFEDDEQPEKEEETREMERPSRSRKKDGEECAFCAIAKKNNEQTQRHVVFRDDLSVAFLDRRPVFLGHCLLTPINHYETLHDLPKDQVGPLFSNAQLLSRAVQDALKADGIFIAINNRVSQSVPHLHIHIVPRRFDDSLRGFFWPRQNYESEEQAVEICNSIRAAVEKLQSAIPTT